MSLHVALIIGTGYELEEEIAYQLAKYDICVLFASKSEIKLHRLIRNLSNEGIEPKMMVLESINMESVDRIIERINNDFGKLDILINVRILLDNGQFKINIFKSQGFEAKNFFETLSISQKFIPLLQKSLVGTIINVYSQMNEGFVNSYTSKIAFTKFTDQFHKEFQNTNLKINSLILGEDKTSQTTPDEANRIVQLTIKPFIEPIQSKTMRILYGIVGEGMGHSTRSKVVLEMLMKEQHHVKVVVSNRAYKFLFDSFSTRFPRCADATDGQAAIDIIEIEGLTMQYVDNVFDEKASVLHTMQRLPNILKKNLGTYYQSLIFWRPQAVISDFDSFAYIFGKAHGLPVLSIDNQHVVQRCFIPQSACQIDQKCFNTYKNFVKAKLPFCNYYIITGFFQPDIREKYRLTTMLVPPILRQAILDAKPRPAEQCSHYLVYQTSQSDSTLIPTLQAFGEKCIVYGLGREETIENLTLKTFSEEDFINDLANARGVIANGGLSLMNEAVSLQRPFFSVPVENQYEQMLNAWYLEEFGYGVFEKKIELECLRKWSDNIPQYARALSTYHHDSNQRLYQTVKRVLDEFRTKFIWWDPLKNFK